MNKYPYYIAPAIEKYRQLNPETTEGKELARLISANIGDLSSLRLILGIDPPEFARFYPDMKVATPGTLDTIDAFLDKFGAGPEPLPLSEDYSAVTIEKRVKSASSNEETPSQNKEETKEASLNELIKQKRYGEALKFIEAQNLNNPQKSIYFAHQIRFIKKLMALKKLKNKNKG